MVKMTTTRNGKIIIKSEKKTKRKRKRNVKGKKRGINDSTKHLGRQKPLPLPLSSYDIAMPVSPLITSLWNVLTHFHSEFDIKQGMKICCCITMCESVC